MHRRRFLALPPTAAAAWLAYRWFAHLPPVHAAIDRLTWWKPSPPPSLKRAVVLEWRYVAGHITEGSEDFGFIVALADYDPPLRKGQELLVSRHDFGTDQTYVSKTYDGAFVYDEPSATYTFTSTDGKATAGWQWDEASGVYRLSVASGELTLTDLVLRPQGDLIAEGGDGNINVGTTSSGIAAGSDYYADWNIIERDGQQLGVARLDMQTVRPATSTALAQMRDYDHRWFAVAGEHNGEPFWLSAWRIETGGPFWAVTLARGSGATWRVESYTETSSVAQPLSIEELRWQPLPADANIAQGNSMGQAWRLQMGVATSGDLLDLTVSVAPGQFITNARVAAAGSQSVMQEAMSRDAQGTLVGTTLTSALLAVAESTFEADIDYREYLHLPLLQ